MGSMTSRSDTLVTFDRGKMWREQWEAPAELTPRERVLERAIWLAVSVLYDITHEVEGAPQPLGPEVRALLALLHAISNGDRGPFDDYWRQAIDPLNWSKADSQAAYLRATTMRTAWEGICDRLGYPTSMEGMKAIARFRRYGRRGDRDARPVI
jgi:hypothetical protein